MERRLEAIEARHRNEDRVFAEMDRELTAMLTLRPASASGGATASNDGSGA
jgi:hypothetical protein